MIEKTLKLIENQIGLKLTLDDYFTGIRISRCGEKYFNVMFKDSVCESREFDQLVRFADKYKSIKVEQNGWKRAAIYYE